MKKLLLSFALLTVFIAVFAFSACSGFDVKIEYDSSTDYGVYWYADGEYVRSSKNMS